ncbi:PAS domain S-box protein [Haloplanus aerogenes]|uniref:histidine kinase n=1 Tax=Haloplanus aerogenes TaxID=660522 RepID=A0A3M0DUQ6_9EURY|nr:PAS domain S-box protein [Haloplanus aerogenes]AZH25913.1 PAS domain S-box protein [Haloplanus aerogenes]RMB25669.1 PAS domain S-box-containing protein [Haloplanus aerogenes]
MNTRQLFLLGLVAVAVVLSGSILVGFQLYKGTVADRHESEVSHTADQVRSELDARLAGHRQTVELWTTTPAVARHGSASQRAALVSFVDETAFAGASVIAANGTMTAIAAGLPAERRRNLTGQDFSERTYHQRAMQGETYVSAPVEAESGNYVITISAPIRRGGRIVGTLNGAFHLSDGVIFESIAASVGERKGVTIRANDGTVIYHSAPTPETDLTVANATLRETGWSVSIRESRSVIRPTIQRTTTLQFGSLIVVLCSIGAVGWWNYRRNLQQIDPLLDGFDALEAHEYGTTIDVGGAPEWERIGEKFNELSHTLEQYLTRIERRERALRRFSRAVEAAGNAVFITDTDGTIEYVNPAFSEITGYDRLDAVGETPNLLDSGEMPDEYFEELWATIRAGEGWEEEIVNRRANGDLYHAKQTIAPITEGDGDEIEGFVAVQIDITERKERERHLQVLGRVLRHNLRNEMSVIQGRAQAIRAEANEAVAADADRIVERCERLLKLGDQERKIVDILVENPERTALPVDTLLGRPVATVRDAHPEATITVDGPDIDVIAMPQMETAMKELLTNAVVHSDQSTPEVTVTVRVDDGRVRIEVADDGPRIPEMERRILVRGQEIEPLFHGSGLGLWLVYWIVTRSGGTLTFHENEPRGNRIRIELPVADTGDKGISSDNSSRET